MRKPAEPLTTSQVELDFGSRVKANALWRNALDTLRAVVARVTPKEAAYQLDTGASNLADALAERDRKALRAEAMLVLLLLADDDERRAVLEPIAAALGFAIEPLEKLTPEQKLARLEEAVRTQLGPLGEQLLKTIDR